MTTKRKKQWSLFPKSLEFLLIVLLLCGVLYTTVITLFAQLAVPGAANGSVITVDGKAYGSDLLGQRFTEDRHLWGRIVNLDITTFKAKDGTHVMYAAPTTLSPASAEFRKLVAERVARLRAADPARANEPVPVDLVTGSGSGLDPSISPAAAEYQVPRIARATGKSEDEVRAIIAKCTTPRFLGIFGEETVNVLRVNLMLDGVLPA